jgi:hypothetical protein
MTRFEIRNRIARQLGYVPASSGFIAELNRLDLADGVMEQPRQLRRYEAMALLLAYREAKAKADAARTALMVAAAACGRAKVADKPLDRVFCRASSERLFFWAQNRNAQV